MDSKPSACDAVPVPRGLLREVLADGCCPLHLRLQLSRCLADEEPLVLDLVDVDSEEVERGPEESTEDDTEVPSILKAGVLATGVLATLNRHCLAGVAAYLPLAEILSVRACSREPLQWAMEREALESQESEPRHRVHDRIRTRLWMRRIADLTAGTKDESVFETQMRSLADEALRSRMEDEMQEALAHMEEQIQSFQAEVDRRLEEQERHVRRMVEERVQQELDAILVSEVAKVQVLVEERVRERVSAIFRREVRETVRELQDKLDTLVRENVMLSDAFAEANLRAKSFFWALHPHPLRVASMVSCGFPLCAISLQRRAAIGSGWQDIPKNPLPIRRVG